MLVLFTVGGAAPGFASGADWNVTPSVSVTELYSDNIRLRPPGEADAAVASILMPGIDISHQASRFQFNLRYRMQNLFYAGGDAPANHIQNFLQSEALAEIVEENIYISTQANVGRLITSNTGAFSPNTVFATNNTTNFQSVRVSPYWQGRIRSYSDGFFGMSYGNTGTGGSNTNTGANLTGTGDSNVLEEFANFQSGTEFSRVIWRANFANSEFSFPSDPANPSLGTSTRYRNGNGELRYPFLDDYSVFVRGGEFDNKFADLAGGGAIRNGAYWNIGGSWNPSPKTALQGGWGTKDYFVGAKWRPTRQTTLEFVYRNSQVGGAYGGTGGSYGGGAGGASASRVYYPLEPTSRRSGVAAPAAAAADTADSQGEANSSAPATEGGYLDSSVSFYNQLGGFNAGTTWNALMRHQGPRSLWCGAYQEVSQPYQALLLYQASLCQPPLLGGVFSSAQQGGVNPLAVNPSQSSSATGAQFGNFDISQPALTSQIITRKRGEISIAVTLPKSDLGLYGYQENRSFQPSATGQDLWGAAAYWDWRFTPRTSALLRSQWQQIRNKSTSPGLASTNDLFLVSFALQRNLTRSLDAYLGYQYLQQTSNVSDNQYYQNGVWAAVNLHF